MLRRAIRLRGALDSSRVFGLTPDQQEFQNVAFEFAKEKIMPFADEWDANHDFPKAVFREAGDLGFGGLYVKDDFGTGLSRHDAALVLESLAYGCPSTAAFISITNMVAGMIDTFGTPDQRSEWLPGLCSMEKIASYCLTEPSSGSDAGALKTTAKLDGDHYVLNGEKQFISGASQTDVYAIMVRTGDDTAAGVTCVLVPKDAEGLSFGKDERKLGWSNQPTKQVVMQDVRIPKSNVLGEVGGGFKIAMKGLDGGRVNIGACSLGGAQRSFDLARDYVKERTQFGKPLAAFQNTQFKLAEMASDLHASRLMIRQAAVALDETHPDRTPFCAMAKLFATEKCFGVVDQALQLHGGYGYLRDYGVEKNLRDLRVHRILEGTSEVMKMITSRNLLA